MNQTVIIVLSIIYASLLTVAVFIAYRRSKRINNAISAAADDLLLVCNVTTLAAAVSCVFPSRIVASVSYSVYFACADVLLIFFLRFYVVYVREPFSNIKWNWIYFLFGLDIVFLAANIFTNVEFDLVKTEYAFGYHYKFHANIGFNIHLIFVGCVAVTLLHLFNVQIKNCASIYKEKYRFLAITFVISLIWDLYSLFKYSHADPGVAVFIIGAIFCHYFSLYYVPNRLNRQAVNLVANILPEGLIILDNDGVCVYANDMAKDYVGIKEQEVLDDESLFEKWLSEYDGEIKEGVVFEKKIVFRRSARTVSVVCHDLIDGDIVIGKYFIIADRTEYYRRLLKQHYESTHDSLTGMYNREYFFSRVKGFLEDNPDTTYYMVASNVHNFKLVNDLFGKERGDEVICRMGNRLASFAKSYDLYGHIVADRFAILIPKDKFVASPFVDLPKQYTYVEENIVYPLNIYFGIYEVNDRSIPPEVMYDRASMAVNSIKGNSNKNIVFYDDEMRQKSIEDQEMLARIKHALENGDFTIFLQPQVASDGTLKGAEALLRWIDPEMGVVSPNVVIPIAEKSGFIGRLDMYVWELACKQLAMWEAAGRTDLTISVNISPKDFYYMDIPKIFEDLTDKYKVNRKNLHLEITETGLAVNVETQIELVQKLKEDGFIVEMDDFGSGFSSLNMLKDIPVDTVKVDMLFLRKTDKFDRLSTILQYCIELCKKLDMGVIVEGVETEKHLGFLEDIGCDTYQGYYFSKPIPIDEFEQNYSIGAN